jgi:hypothetical protein
MKRYSPDQYYRDNTSGAVYLKDGVKPISGTVKTISAPVTQTQQFTNQAAADPYYKQQTGFIDQEAQLAQNELKRQQGAIESSTALQKQQLEQAAAQQRADIKLSTERTRQDLIRSYQDALDVIGYNAKQVGFQTKIGAAQNQLYDASGQLSGIGQNVASNAIQPIMQQTRKLAESQGTNLGRLTQDEQIAYGKLSTSTQNAIANLDQTSRDSLGQITSQLAQIPLQSSKQKADIMKTVVDSIIKGYKEQQEALAAQRKEQQDALAAQQKEARRQFEVDRAYALREYTATKPSASSTKSSGSSSKSSSSGSSGSSTKPQTTTQIKNSLISDINGAADIVVTSYNPQKIAGPGIVNQKTREEVAMQIFDAYKDDGYTLEQIKKMIYDAYPDNYR